MPDDIGSALEATVARLTGGRRVKQSGGGKFRKLDVIDTTKFVYSCKATRRLGDAAVRAIWKLWVEAREGARGPAGYGDGAKPAMVFEVEGEILVLLRLGDHVSMMTAPSQVVASTKAQDRRAKALSNPRDRNNGNT